MASTALRLARAATAASHTQRLLHTSTPARKIYANILETIGNTPVVRVANIAPKNVNLYVKCEYFNPLSSVKDRLALGIIEDAERNGTLKPGQTVIEATSGNTGIAMAMVCAQKGYPCVITMAEPFSVERRKVMRMLGAKVVITPAAEKGTGMVKKAKELANEHGYFLARQFENDANPAMHAATTGPEIVDDFKEIGLDYWVTGYGTGGTLQGAGKVVKEGIPGVKIVISEPANAAILTSGAKQERESDGSSAKTHEAFNPHPIQGWTPDFIPKITEDAMAMDIVDEILLVSGPDAINASKNLAKGEGIFTGISGGATFWTALEVAKTAPDGSNILCMLPDTGERYLSTPLFEGIEADMDDAELALSTSTPGYQLASN